MNVKELSEKLNLKILTQADMEREIENCYCGDLLSWVMSRAKSGNAWLTVMGNVNAVAVASLADLSCIILTENAALDKDAETKANIAGITILQTEKNAYETAVEISKLI